MRELLKSSNWISGLQWLFFIFANIVVIPITVGAAFGFTASKVVSLLQLSFIVTGLACMAQAILGHKRAIMEGQSGLWWGVILTLCYSVKDEGISLPEMGGSLTVGIIISAVLTIIIGLIGLGPYLAKLFNPAVMGVFMFLLGTKLITIFFKGLLGIPFGQAPNVHIDLPISLLSILIVIFVILINIKAPPAIRRYGLLIGIMVGWACYTFLFTQKEPSGFVSSSHFAIFPLGKPAWNLGIMMTAIFTGLLNTANTFGALKGTDSIYQQETTKHQYKLSFLITGIVNIIAGIFGLVPYAPYVSSIGFLSQTGIIKRIPFILGGFLFLVMGIIPPLGHFFSMLPLSIGSAVLFVAYLQLFNSSWTFFEKVKLNTQNIYRAAIPLFVGIVMMSLPTTYFITLPAAIRPLLSSGLLVGIFLSLLLENLFHWEKG